MRSRVLLPLLLLLATTLPISAAWACSCVMQTAEEFVSQPDGGPVFVGTLIDRGALEQGPEQLAEWTFDVDRVLVGELPAEITIVASADGALCGLALEPGARVGLKLFPGEDRWTSNGCSVHDADALLAVAGGAEPLPVDPTTEAPDEGAGRDEPGSEPPWLGLAATAAAAIGTLGGIVMLARRRRTGP